MVTTYTGVICRIISLVCNGHVQLKKAKAACAKRLQYLGGATYNCYADDQQMPLSRSKVRLFPPICFHSFDALMQPYDVFSYFPSKLSLFKADPLITAQTVPCLPSQPLSRKYFINHLTEIKQG